MNTRKIKLAHPIYFLNRLKKVKRYVPIADSISDLIKHQADRVNNYNLYGARPDVLNPGPWTLHWDGKDFYFEGTEQTIINSDLLEHEAQE